jgi:hypothetical protein
MAIMFFDYGIKKLSKYSETGRTGLPGIEITGKGGGCLTVENRLQAHQAKLLVARYGGADFVVVIKHFHPLAYYWMRNFTKNILYKSKKRRF